MCWFYWRLALIICFDKFNVGFLKNKKTFIYWIDTRFYKKYVWNFCFFKKIKIKRIIIEKLEKMQPSLSLKGRREEIVGGNQGKKTEEKKKKKKVARATLELYCHQALLLKEEPPR